MTSISYVKIFEDSDVVANLMVWGPTADPVGLVPTTDERILLYYNDVT